MCFGQIPSEQPRVPNRPDGWARSTYVYKYADRSQLFYQCQIRITIKEPNSECERPKCTEPQGFGAVLSLRVLNQSTKQLFVFSESVPPRTKTHSGCSHGY
uniref:Cuticlin-1 n=1 Tax=Ascaris suum TaxID=6253 RepID=F1LG22_ASCSU